MFGDRSRPRIPLPKQWPSRVRSGVLHAISLAHFSLTFTRSQACGVLLSWTTVAEVDTVAFRLLQETAGAREKALKVIAPMIPAAGNGLTGASYQFLDNTYRAGSAAHYYIEDIDIFGKVTRHGPIAVERVHATRRAEDRRSVSTR